MTGPSNELRYENYLASSHRPAFDGMRGIGFLLVITAHIPSVPLFRLPAGMDGGVAVLRRSAAIW